MAENCIKYKKDENIGIIEISDSLTAENIPMQLGAELAALCNEINSDKTVTVIVLSGKNSFNINEETIDKILKKTPDLFSGFCSPAEAVFGLEQPVIAAVSGNAVGPGLEMILACDMRIADDKSKFGLPHIKNGIIPWDGGTQRLTRLVGRTKASEMILTGDIIDSNEALQSGLVNKLAEPDMVLSDTLNMAKKMAGNAPFALKYAKEAINKGMDLTLEQSLNLEADLYFLLHSTKDRIEGIKAFQEKRPGKFEGR